MGIERVQGWLRGLANPDKGAAWARRLGDALLVFAIILLAGSAAKTTWRLLEPFTSNDLAGVPASSTVGSSDLSNASAGSTQTSSRARLAEVADYHLFGRPPQGGQGPAQQIPTNAPETRLDLSLKGILSSGAEGRGAAIIDTGNQQKVFLAGAELPGDAVLVQVQNDRVILSRAGNYEMLRLERDILDVAENSVRSPSVAKISSSFVERGDGSRRLTEITDSANIPEYSANGQESPSGSGESAANRAAPQTTARIERSEVESLHQELRNDPSKLADMVQIRPVLSGGSIRGFRLTPRNERASAYFEQAGLRPGDLILEVNGVSAANHNELRNMVNQLDSTSRVRLRIERNGTEQQVVVRID